jgi:hypothetical protein
MPDTETIITWLLSGSGRLTCAALLFALVWAIKNVPWVKVNLLTTTTRKRAAVVALAALPALALALVSNQGTEQIIQTFLTAVVGAMGLHNLTSNKDDDGGDSQEKPDAIVVDEENET